MKPLFLSIEGLQSFQEKQSIDFEKIGKDGLFGIFGPTGSGKSTIIDAITLALYGSIVRFDKSSESKDSFDIEAVNKNSSETNVNFKFKVGENIYRIERNYKIGKKSGKLTRNAILYKIENNEDIKIAENHKEIYQKIKDDILGLTLEDFTRSVVLPQGNFSKFLKLDGKEKRDMLERIFNLEKYGEILSKKSNDYKYTLENQLKKLDIELNAIGFNENELKEKEEELLKSQKELENLKIKDIEITKELKELEEIEKLEIKLNELNIEKEKLDNKKDEISAFEKNISFAEKFIPVIEKIDKKNEYGEKIEIFSKELEKNRELFKIGNDKLNDKKQVFLNLEKSEIEKLNERKENYVPQEDVLKISDSYKSALRKKELEDKKIKLENEINFLLLNLDKLTLEEKNIILEKENLKNIYNNIKEFSQDELLELEKNIIEKSNILNEEKNKYKKIEDLKNEIINIENNLNKYQTDFENLKSIEEEYQKNRENYFIYEIKKNLHEGDICPVCHSKYHIENNLKDEISFNNEDFEKIQKEMREINSKIYILKEQKEDKNKIVSSLSNELQNIEILIQEIENLKTQKDNYKLEYENSKKLKLSTEENIKNTEKTLHEIEIKISNIKNEVSFKNKNIEEISKEIINITANTSIDELKKQLDDFKIKAEKLKDIDIALEELRKNKKNAYEKIEEWNNKIKDFEKKLIQDEENFKNLQLEYSNLSEEINKILFENNIIDLEYIENIKQHISNFEFMKKEVEDFKNSNIKTLSMILDVNNQLKNRTFSKEKYKSLSECGKIIKVSLEKNMQIIGEIKKSIEIFNLNKLKAETIIKEKEKVELKLNPAKELCELLKGKKFLDFLSAGKLQSITRIASETLQKITNGRYRINVDEKSDFSIIDNFNSAIRKPQSLSGGETFMVSLCLALALANQIQLRGKSRLEFFFLDEGFGTLDSELLEIVFSVLENLKSEGMTVGIITHVEEIKNRVTRKLIVTPARVGESGTLVKEI